MKAVNITQHSTTAKEFSVFNFFHFTFFGRIFLTKYFHIKANKNQVFFTFCFLSVFSFLSNRKKERKNSGRGSFFCSLLHFFSFRSFIKGKKSKAAQNKGKKRRKKNNIPLKLLLLLSCFQKAFKIFFDLKVKKNIYWFLWLTKMNQCVFVRIESSSFFLFYFNIFVQRKKLKDH